MTEEQIQQTLDSELNKRGKSFGIHYDVELTWRIDGDWTQYFVREHANGHRPASRQIIADVEEELSKRWGRELLVVLVS